MRLVQTALVVTEVIIDRFRSNCFLTSARNREGDVENTEATLLNTIRKLLWFEITKMLIRSLKKINLLCHSL